MSKHHGGRIQQLHGTRGSSLAFNIAKDKLLCKLFSPGLEKAKKQRGML